MGKSLRRNKSGNIIINRLASVLKEEGIPNKALAEALGYDRTTISKWTTNTSQPAPSTFLRIALLINRDLKDLFISTKEIPDTDRKRLLKALADLAEKSKGNPGKKG